MAAMAVSLASAMSNVSLGAPSCSGLRIASSSTPSVSLALPSTGYKRVQGLPYLSIRCARVGGVEVPNAKRIEISLQYIHGIGKTTARQILLDVELENKHTRDLSEEELTKLRDEVSKYMIEGDLRRFNTLAIKRLKDIQCYRGKRHIMGLPCRGQHTKCNARTRRGKKVTVAGKKKAPGK
ncbi:small subunit ribosomal protein S13 [Marchantia polymorpha subsp. ruderalis]|uniref:30S ribosomal protein S13, chloroplastic n=2 Tax=Marchantia polymorpha TaxID=3197 RepID=A0AAF6ARH4_MARPO|nr:hypothetical protein MARPO_0001s0161 [Marchantia polymorpha]BBM99044.1 hypothetical protein Mp_1g18230 [Marchantia polymorpha subsp. ruderalis]|eukprot:PTQ50119.1 hypothetical protein MARPO_0001s0161 [Marchantia polymorpha]